MSMIGKRALGWSSLVALTVGVACSSDPDNPGNPPNNVDACANIEAQVASQQAFESLARFVAVETHRTGDQDPNEAKVIENVKKLEAALQAEIDDFNKGQKDKLEPFNWQTDDWAPGADHPNFRVFGVRFGRGPHKVGISTHLDTVPPGDKNVWEPFTLKRDNRLNPRTGKTEEYWVGRGSIDDKGPAISSLQALKAIAKKYDGSKLLDAVTVELFFDTSEETTSSTAAYFKAKPAEEPDLAVIFDASWCIRAEKGVERPVFTINRDAALNKKVWVDSLTSGEGPANQIPDTVTAVIKADTSGASDLNKLATEIVDRYNQYQFDDPTYRRAELIVDKSKLGDPAPQLTLTTKVKGAQHGSRPDENRKDGANPLVSLTNFVAYLVREGKVADNDVGRMSKFIEWNWGTRVFGEVRPGANYRQDDVLKKSDDVFQEGNGTSYAITRFYTLSSVISLRVDIRYALGHHSVAWDGKTEGYVGPDTPANKSNFQGIFTSLVTQFNTAAGAGPALALEKTTTGAIPDIRLPGGASFSRISDAYRAVMNQPCPARAIGGGTDAKGHTNFIAAGALFDNNFGPPVNFHGLSEAAPVSDLQLSTKIICKFLDEEVKNSPNVKQSLKVQSAKTPWHTESHSGGEDLH
ncbi:M20/M25/M40 family metallo-hydrolase [Pendulispora albinea]|uniref:M20/M25/M40 family metallo-hydrolase n=1 Tax=Pendulispora albinea TaxID=2741071 RepID=A0ABZ2LK62_9BACT